MRQERNEALDGVQGIGRAQGTAPTRITANHPQLCKNLQCIEEIYVKIFNGLKIFTSYPKNPSNYPLTRHDKTHGDRR